MKKLCFVTAFPLNLRWFMSNHMLRLAEDYEVTAVANFTAEDLAGDWFPGVRLVAIPVTRQINLRTDLIALWGLVNFFRHEHFDIVHSITPKGGLLAMTAARIVGVPHRIHCFTGQVWANRVGLERVLLKCADRMISVNANHLLTDSLSQREFLENEGVIRIGQSEVLGVGSISGVDLARFQPDEEIRKQIRLEWGVPPTACLMLFIGRLKRDKGILDLAQAFSQITLDHNDIWLVVVGQDEENIHTEFERLCSNSLSNVCRFGYTSKPEHAMAAADLLVLPSYREGFGNVVIEAAACGIPAVASNIYGLTDAIEDNVTGLLHPPGDIKALGECLQRLCTDRTLRLKMGMAARVRVQSNFSMQSVTAALVAYYNKILGL